MLRARIRSFPFVALAVVVLLLFALTVSLAEDKKKDDAAQSQGQQQAPAATSKAPPAQAAPSWLHRQPAPTPPKANAPAAPATQPSPGWRQPAPVQSPPAGRGNWQNREQGNPYNRNRTPEQPSQPTYRSQPPVTTQTPAWRNRNEPQERTPAPSRRTQDQSRERTQPATPRADPYGWNRSRERSQPSDNNAPRSDRWDNRNERSAPEARTRPTPRENTVPETPTWNRDRTAPSDRQAPEVRTRPNWRDNTNEDVPDVRNRTQNRPTPERVRPNDQGRDRTRVPEQNGDRNRVPDRPQTQNRPQTPRSNVVARQNIRTRVPEAVFRGPEAEKRVVNIPQQRQQQITTRLRDGLRQWNRGNNNAIRGGHITRDVVGNQVPRDARFIDRGIAQHLKLSYSRVEHRLGPATNFYAFIPRHPNDYWNGYWDGYQDGYWDGRRHIPHSSVVINFYYGYYYSDPGWFGFYYPGYYASVYHYYGYCPGWVYPTRVYVYPTEYVYWPADPYRYYERTRVDERGAERAIGDIRRAWVNNDVDLLSRHLTDELDVQVYFDGEYEYTTSTEDYYGMTADALATTETSSIEFDDPIFISSHEVFYTGRHVFYDGDGYRQTVYVSYRMRKLGGEWYIVAVGSSLEPIRHKYTDFRYH